MGLVTWGVPVSPSEGLVQTVSAMQSPGKITKPLDQFEVA